MATLNVAGVIAVGFPVETTITAPDANTWILPANTWAGIPDGQTSMTVTPGGPAMCMTLGRTSTQGGRAFLQVMTVDEIRTSA